MKTAIIIQARMTSTRLPGKVLLPLCNDTALGMMLRRLQHFKPSITIATTDDGSESPILEFCKSHEVSVVCGSVDDVLDRYFQAASTLDLCETDAIVRLTSDCPLMDPNILQTMLDLFKKTDCDYLSNCIERTYPRGLDIEIFTFSALKQAHRNAKEISEREHVTPYIRNHMNCHSYKDQADHSGFRLTLDEEDDYKAITAVYQALSCRTDFSYAELIDTLLLHPEIVEINQHIEQKKV